MLPTRPRSWSSRPNARLVYRLPGGGGLYESERFELLADALQGDREQTPKLANAPHDYDPAAVAHDEEVASIAT